MSSDGPALAHTLPPQDVTVHLRPAPARLVSVQEKEALIRSGVSYGELLTPEGVPSAAQRRAYADALDHNGARVGELLAALTASVLREYDRPVLVSLARAGTTVGCAMSRLSRRWAAELGARALPHHTLSIIRGRGIDRVALARVQAAHPGAQLVFVDGWTGKGSIEDTLRGSLPADVPARLAVLSDPAGVATHAATHEDLLLPHAALNATVCGLLSRTFYTDPAQLHAARIDQRQALIAAADIVVKVRPPAVASACTADCSAQRVSPKLEFSTFAPKYTCPSGVRRAAPTRKRLKGAYACLKAAFAPASSCASGNGLE